MDVFELLCSTRQLLKIWRECSFMALFNIVSTDAFSALNKFLSPPPNLAK